jgi:hypothetical protein
MRIGVAQFVQVIALNFHIRFFTVNFLLDSYLIVFRIIRFLTRLILICLMKTTALAQMETASFCGGVRRKR